MCFNAAKSWDFGWYSSRHVVINPTNGYFHGLFIGIDDFLNTVTSSNYNVVGKVGDYYLMYNRKKGVNSQVQGDGDTVTIIRQPSSGSVSWNEGQLIEASGSDTFVKAGWGGTGKDLVIKVCERRFGTPDYARVLVYLSNVPKSCNDPLIQAGPILSLLTTVNDNNGAGKSRESGISIAYVCVLMFSFSTCFRWESV
jgi:hypothetical protein